MEDNGALDESGGLNERAVFSVVANGAVTTFSSVVTKLGSDMNANNRDKHSVATQ